MAKRTIDWDYWQHKYVTGDDSVSLEVLSNIPNAPSLVSLKKQCRKDSWVEHRKNFRYQVESKVSLGILDKQVESRVNQITQTQKLVDTSEIITQHLMIARGGRAIIAKRLKEIATNPEEISKLSFRDLGAFLKVITDLERLAMGLATERTEIDVNVDLTALSDDQLERLAQGEAPQYVLN